VPLTGHDVWRLSHGLRVHPAEFVLAYSEEPNRPGGFRLRKRGETYVLALEKRGSVARGQPCIFLDEREDGTSRCGVYAIRPAVCRAYPMVAAETPGQMVLRPGALCPPDAWSPDEPARPAWRAAWQTLDDDFQRYDVVARSWNAAVDQQPKRVFSLHDYLTYVLRCYDRLALAGLIASL
jgi:Fe-S-cluster containining protein